MGVQVTINKKEITVPQGVTILQACELAGVQVPRFCYHEKLSIAGNCRMCLVHLDKSVKPVASCAISVAPGMKIFTDSSVVKKAREGVMEFLLANHPLDCPICDQGGECDLQDQAMFFGNDRGRFYETKRAVSDKNCGPLIKTVMTRCIHCTRCVRFSQELSGSPELTTTGRGSKTEIGNYVSKAVTSVVSGNLIDLCPVGALTSKPYAFTARSWELKKTETIDTLDSMCSNISVHTSGRRIMRVLPVLHEGINQEWINDRTRFSYDGLQVQRLVNPFILSEGENLKKASWRSTLNILSYFFSLMPKEKPVHFFLGDEFDLETAYFVKKLRFLYPNSFISHQHMLSELNLDFRRNYLLNSSLVGIDKIDSCLIVGTDLVKEMPLVLMRLRKQQRSRTVSVGVVGSPSELGLTASFLGNTFSTLVNIVEGRHSFCTVLKRSEFPSIFVGPGVLESASASVLIPLLQGISCLKTSGWDGLNFIHLGASKVGSFELGLGNDTPKMLRNTNLRTLAVGSTTALPVDVTNSFYMGSHGSSDLQKFLGLIPAPTSVEKEGIYMNLEGRAQQTHICVNPSGNVRSEYKILGGLVYLLQDTHMVPDTLESVRNSLGKVSNFYYNSVGYSSFSCTLLKKGSVGKGLISHSLNNFYVINSRTKVSKSMNSSLVSSFGLKKKSCYIDN